MKKIQFWIIILLLVLIVVFGMIYYKNKVSVNLAPDSDDGSLGAVEGDSPPFPCKCPYVVGQNYDIGKVISIVGCPDGINACSARVCSVRFKMADGVMYDLYNVKCEDR